MRDALESFNAPIDHEDVGTFLCMTYVLDSIGLEKTLKTALLLGYGSRGCRNAREFDSLVNRAWVDVRKGIPRD